MQHAQPAGGGGVNIHVGRDASGQITIGDHNTAEMHHTAPTTPTADPAEAPDLTSALARLRELIETAGLDETATRAALVRVDELEEAVTADRPDLATMEEVQGWFGRRMPAFAGTVHRLLLGPLVTRAVAAAGDELAQEFTRRIGT